jgi:SOS response regulatory protein OraA/RecX
MAKKGFLTMWKRFQRLKKKSNKSEFMASIKEIYTTVGTFLARQGYSGDEIDSILASLDEDSMEDILLSHGVIIEGVSCPL